MNLKELNATGELFEPSMNESRKEQLYKGWKKAVKATQLFAEIETSQDFSRIESEELWNFQRKLVNYRLRKCKNAPWIF